MPTSTRSKAAKAHGPNVWVVPYQGKFSVRLEGKCTLLIPPSAQYVAVSIGRHLARANFSELIVQARSGRIRLRDSHGFDSCPPRG